MVQRQSVRPSYRLCAVGLLLSARRAEARWMIAGWCWVPSSNKWGLCIQLLTSTVNMADLSNLQWSMLVLLTSHSSKKLQTTDYKLSEYNNTLKTTMQTAEEARQSRVGAAKQAVWRMGVPSEIQRQSCGTESGGLSTLTKLHYNFLSALTNFTGLVTCYTTKETLMIRFHEYNLINYKKHWASVCRPIFLYGAAIALPAHRVSPPMVGWSRV